MSDTISNGAQKQFILFTLGQTHFAVPILQALRIVRLEPITRVPRAPAFLEGVVNFHGKVVPVVDLHKRLNLPEVAYQDAARILMVELGAQIVGMLVDEVIGLLRLPAAAIQPAPDMVAQVNGVYLTGVAHLDERLIVFLDLTRVLSVDEVSELQAWQPSESARGGGEG